jgi:hypothetical protein
MPTHLAGTFVEQSHRAGARFRALVLCLLAGTLLLGLSGGCARPRISPQEPPAYSAPPAPPDELRLGASYISALNELCYEAFALDGSSARPRAYCQRSGSWLLLPDVYMAPPESFQRDAARR